ncbi:MAG: tRNA 2-thiouridine(34) synthase MnmA [Polyangiales bacterium]
MIVAMSGGVDSAVAAALLQAQGHDLVGVTLHLWDASGAQMVGRCCSPEDRDDARRVSEHLGIPHYTFDERTAFRQAVVDPFVAAYARGITPAPCVRCNRSVKLGHLEAIADELGAATIATGHYAQLWRRDDAVVLARGRDAGKDQSYFLFGLRQSLLRRLCFPLGALDKGETRRLAQDFGLPNADKADSQELCFVPDGDVAGFVTRQGATQQPGPIRDASGALLGEHRGLAGYTVGQRRGLGLAGGPPRYVLKLVPERNEVVVGEEDALAADVLHAAEAAWNGPVPREAFVARVQIRSRHKAAPAEVIPTAEGFCVRFAAPQRAIAPGQAAVVYVDDVVRGGGIITAAGCGA